MAKKKQEFKDTKDIFKSIVSSMKVDDSSSVVEWVLNNDIRTEDNTPIHYNDRKYLIDMMNDLSPKQSIMASAQVSKTVSMYVKALYMNYKGLNIAFSQPTADLRDLLTKSKLNRIIDNTEIFKNNVSGDLNIKTAWDRMLFLVYTFGNAQVGYTTDLNIYDEVSRSNPTTIDMLKSRQLNSKYKYEWFISNPSVPNDLLHNTFLKSDQKHWFVKCHKCQTWQLLNYDGFLGFEGNVDKEKGQFVCQVCKRVLDPEEIRNGEWVKRYEDRDISGYHIHQLMRPTDTLEEQHNLVKELIYEEEKSKQTFYNMFLGLPYSGSDVSIDAPLFMNNLIEPGRAKNHVVMGCDIGSATGHHYVIGANNKVFKMGRAKDWKEIRNLMREYNVQMCVVDNMPENGAAKELQQEYPNMVWRANYVGNKSEDQIRYDEETGLVNIARNIIFDNIVNDLNDGKYKFAYHPDDNMLDDFIRQFGTLAKIAEFDRHGNPTFKWEAPDGAWDHFAHGFLYFTIATHRLEMMLPKYGITKNDDEFAPLKGSSRDTWTRPKKSNNNWLDL